MAKIKLSDIPDCKKCGERGEVVQITDGQWTKDFYTFMGSVGEFELDGSNTDGCGDQYIECSNCGKKFNEKDNKKLNKLIF